MLVCIGDEAAAPAAADSGGDGGAEGGVFQESRRRSPLLHARHLGRHHEHFVHPLQAGQV